MTGPPPTTAPELDALFVAEYPGMLRLARLLCGSDATAEELVMDALVAIAPHHASIAHPGAYLRTSVINGARSAGRRRATERRHLHMVAIDPAAEDRAAGPSDVDRMWGVLGELSTDQRTCIVLRCYEDLTIDRIAEVTGIPVGTVKSHIHRAASRLRILLEEPT